MMLTFKKLEEILLVNSQATKMLFFQTQAQS